jgi:hypothetical protein
MIEPLLPMHAAAWLLQSGAQTEERIDEQVNDPTVNASECTNA